MKKRNFKLDTENVHQLLVLSPALTYHLSQAEEIRKKIAKLSLRAKK